VTLGTPAFARRARGILLALLYHGLLGAGPAPAAVLESAQMSVDVDAAEITRGVDKTFEVSDVIPGSPAAPAGLEPGSKIVAIDGRSLSEHDVQAQLDAALTNARHGPGLHLLLVGGDVYRDVR